MGCIISSDCVGDCRSSTTPSRRRQSNRASSSSIKGNNANGMPTRGHSTLVNYSKGIAPPPTGSNSSGRPYRQSRSSSPRSVGISGGAHSLSTGANSGFTRGGDSNNLVNNRAALLNGAAEARDQQHQRNLRRLSRISQSIEEEPGYTLDDEHIFMSWPTATALHCHRDRHGEITLVGTSHSYSNLSANRRSFRSTSANRSRHNRHSQQGLIIDAFPVFNELTDDLQEGNPTATAADLNPLGDDRRQNSRGHKRSTIRNRRFNTSGSVNNIRRHNNHFEMVPTATPNIHNHDPFPPPPPPPSHVTTYIQPNPTPQQPITNQSASTKLHEIQYKTSDEDHSPARVSNPPMTRAGTASDLNTLRSNSIQPRLPLPIEQHLIQHQNQFQVGVPAINPLPPWMILPPMVHPQQLPVFQTGTRLAPSPPQGFQSLNPRHTLQNLGFHPSNLIAPASLQDEWVQQWVNATHSPLTRSINSDARGSQIFSTPKLSGSMPGSPLSRQPSIQLLQQMTSAASSGHASQANTLKYSVAALKDGGLAELGIGAEAQVARNGSKKSGGGGMPTIMLPSPLHADPDCLSNNTAGDISVNVIECTIPPALFPRDLFGQPPQQQQQQQQPLPPADASASSITQPGSLKGSLSPSGVQVNRIACSQSGLFGVAKTSDVASPLPVSAPTESSHTLLNVNNNSEGMLEGSRHTTIVHVPVSMVSATSASIDSKETTMRSMSCRVGSLLAQAPDASRGTMAAAVAEAKSAVVAPAQQPRPPSTTFHQPSPVSMLAPTPNPSLLNTVVLRGTIAASKPSSPNAAQRTDSSKPATRPAAADANGLPFLHLMSVTSPVVAAAITSASQQSTSQNLGAALTLEPALTPASAAVAPHNHHHHRQSGASKSKGLVNLVNVNLYDTYGAQIPNKTGVSDNERQNESALPNNKGNTSDNNKADSFHPTGIDIGSQQSPRGTASHTIPPNVAPSPVPTSIYGDVREEVNMNECENDDILEPIPFTKASKSGGTPSQGSRRASQSHVPRSIAIRPSSTTTGDSTSLSLDGVPSDRIDSAHLPTSSLRTPQQGESLSNVWPPMVPFTGEEMYSSYVLSDGNGPNAVAASGLPVVGGGALHWVPMAPIVMPVQTHNFNLNSNPPSMNKVEGRQTRSEFNSTDYLRRKHKNRSNKQQSPGGEGQASTDPENNNATEYVQRRKSAPSDGPVIEISVVAPNFATAHRHSAPAAIEGTQLSHLLEPKQPKTDEDGEAVKSPKSPIPMYVPSQMPTASNVHLRSVNASTSRLSASQGFNPLGLDVGGWSNSGAFYSGTSPSASQQTLSEVVGASKLSSRFPQSPPPMVGPQSRLPKRAAQPSIAPPLGQSAPANATAKEHTPSSIADSKNSQQNDNSGASSSIRPVSSIKGGGLRFEDAFGTSGSTAVRNGSFNQTNVTFNSGTQSKGSADSGLYYNNNHNNQGPTSRDDFAGPTVGFDLSSAAKVHKHKDVTLVHSEKPEGNFVAGLNKYSGSPEMSSKSPSGMHPLVAKYSNTAAGSLRQRLRQTDQADSGLNDQKEVGNGVSTESSFPRLQAFASSCSPIGTEADVGPLAGSGLNDNEIGAAGADSQSSSKKASPTLILVPAPPPSNPLLAHPFQPRISSVARLEPKDSVTRDNVCRLGGTPPMLFSEVNGSDSTTPSENHIWGTVSDTTTTSGKTKLPRVGGGLARHLAHPQHLHFLPSMATIHTANIYNTLQQQQHPAATSIDNVISNNHNNNNDKVAENGQHTPLSFLTAPQSALSGNSTAPPSTAAPTTGQYHNTISFRRASISSGAGGGFSRPTATPANVAEEKNEVDSSTVVVGGLARFGWNGSGAYGAGGSSSGIVAAINNYSLASDCWAVSASSPLIGHTASNKLLMSANGPLSVNNNTNNNSAWPGAEPLATNQEFAGPLLPMPITATSAASTNTPFPSSTTLGTLTTQPHTPSTNTRTVTTTTTFSNHNKDTSSGASSSGLVLLSTSAPPAAQPHPSMSDMIELRHPGASVLAPPTPPSFVISPFTGSSFTHYGPVQAESPKASGRPSPADATPTNFYMGPASTSASGFNMSQTRNSNMAAANNTSIPGFSYSSNTNATTVNGGNPLPFDAPHNNSSRQFSSGFNNTHSSNGRLCSAAIVNGSYTPTSNPATSAFSIGNPAITMALEILNNDDRVLGDEDEATHPSVKQLPPSLSAHSPSATATASPHTIGVPSGKFLSPKTVEQDSTKPCTSSVSQCNFDTPGFLNATATLLSSGRVEPAIGGGTGSLTSFPNSNRWGHNSITDPHAHFE